MDLRDQLAVVRRRLRLISATLLVTAFAAGLVSLTLPKTYQSQAALIVGNSINAVSPDLNQVLLSQRLSQTYAQVATQRATLQRVIDRLGLAATTDDLASRVSAEARQDSTILVVSASDRDPIRAAAIANGIADELITSSPAIQGSRLDIQAFIDEGLQETRAQIASSQAQINTLSAKRSPTSADLADLAALRSQLVGLQTTFSDFLSLSSSASANRLTLSDPAIPATQPASPKLALNLALGIVIGLVLGLAFAFLVEQFDQTVRTPEEATAATGLPTLGTIGKMRLGYRKPKLYFLAMLLYPRSAVAERFRALRTNVAYANGERPLRTILVTSAMPGEGKTIFACNLAIAFAQADLLTVLVDADLRRPTVHEVFRLPNLAGLSGLLKGEDLRVESFLQSTEEANLKVLSAGVPVSNPSELLQSRQLSLVLTKLAGSADVIIIDSPPLRAVSDPAILAAIADGTLLVIEAGKTSRRAISRSLESIARTGGHMLGVALNSGAGVGRRRVLFLLCGTSGRAQATDGSERRARPRPRARGAEVTEPRRALLTGITGQDGSYLTELLLGKGYEVHGIMRRSSSFSTQRIDHLYQDPQERGAQLHLHYGDLSDSSSLINTINRVRPHEVYNLGAQSHVAVSFEMPEFTADTVATGTLRLLEAIRHADWPVRFYQAGSSEMFGLVQDRPQTERTVFHPRSPYAVAKVFAHWMTVHYREAYGLFACNGILFNHESPRRGRTFVTRKITRGVAEILAGRVNRLYLGNLDARRDWGFAPEYVNAMWTMLQQDEPDDYVIATGEMHTVREFAEAAFALVGLDWSRYVQIDPRYLRPTEVDELWGDASKAGERFGWRPQTRFGDLVAIMLEADLIEAGLRPADHLIALGAIKASAS